MKLLRNLFYCIAIVSLWTACSNESEDSDNTENNNLITVNTYIPSSTRNVNKTTFEDGDVIGLYACTTDGNYSDIFKPNYMDNIALTRTGGMWNYSPMLSWPAEDKVSFMAFYPRNTNASTAYNAYPFTVSTDIDKQVDALWCTVKNACDDDRNGTAVNGNEDDAAFEASSGALNLKFKHMLSKVRFVFKLAKPYPGIDVRLNSLTLSSVKATGTFVMNNDLTGGSWTKLDNPATFKLQDAEAMAAVIPNTGEYVIETMMMPQGLQESGAYLDVSYTHTLAEGGETTVTRHIYLPEVWQIGNVYNYTFNLKLGVNTLNVSSEVVSWDGTDEGRTNELKKVEAVDLGLSKKWANMDYGTTAPYQKAPTFGGNYYNKSFANEFIWGANWSVPTRADWMELSKNCTVKAATVNGISGYNIVSKINGKSIFMTLADYMTSTTNSDSKYHLYVVRLTNGKLSINTTIDDYHFWIDGSSTRKAGIRPVYTE